MPNVLAVGRSRADACPGTLQTHDAADGPLARVRVPGGSLTSAQLAMLGAAARELGVDVIELTSRGNLQLRGVRDPAVLAERVAGAGLLPSPAHERARNIVASPLGGRGRHGVLGTDPLVSELDRALCARPRLAGLPGRFLFALDDGTGDVASLNADLTLTPEGLLLSGARLDLPRENPVPVLVAAAEAFLDVRGDAWRLAEVPGGARLVAERLGVTVADGPRIPESPPPHAGVIEQRDERVALEAVPPLGRMSGAQAEALAETAQDIRVTPWRGVVIPDLTRADVRHAMARLEAAGFATEPDSPWVGVTACTGSPGCAKSQGDVQGEAHRWVDRLERAPETPVHWTGCDRRCGMPRGPVVLKTVDGEGR